MASRNGDEVNGTTAEQLPICIDLTEDEEGIPVKKFVISIGESCQQLDCNLKPGTLPSAVASTSSAAFPPSNNIGTLSSAVASTSSAPLPPSNKIHRRAYCSKCKRGVQPHMRSLDCSHDLCYECLIKTLRRNKETINYCPHQECKKQISDKVIKGNLLSPDYISFLEHARNNYRRVVGEIPTLLPAVAQEVIDISEEPTGFADLQKVYERKYVQNFEPFDCPICFMDVPTDGGIILKSCFHQFCLACVIDTVRYSPLTVIFCPYDSQGNQSCNFPILDSELRAILPADVLERHLEKSLKQGESVLDNVFHCKAPNCDGFVVKKEETIAFVCPLCEIVNCVKCSAIHEDKTCEQYQEDIKIDTVNQQNLLLTNEAVEELLKNGKVRE